MEKNCPCCDKHCPVEMLSCGEGRRHFGMEDARREGAAEERMIVLLRRCGHFLHHSMGPGANAAALTEALSADERATLEALLEKCLKHWERLPQPEGHGHGEGRHPHHG